MSPDVFDFLCKAIESSFPHGLRSARIESGESRHPPPRSFPACFPKANSFRLDEVPLWIRMLVSPSGVVASS
jgi:hypothetical protein